MIRVSAILLLAFASCVSESIACINGVTINALKNGFILFEDAEGFVPRGHRFVNAEEFRKELNELDGLFKTTNDLDYLSDSGVLLILLERYQEAIDLYLEIEKQTPDRYSTASNIGTAYELIGDNENALKWIKRAVEIDSSSHENSEWIHVKILEAKIKGESFYTTQHLLNTDFGPGDEPVSKLGRGQLESLHRALYYQLNERVSFIKNRDKIVAQLFFDLGDIAFLLGEASDAIEDYGFAQYYGFEERLIKVRINESKQYIASQQRAKWFKKYGGPLAIGIILMAAIAWLIRFIILKQMNE